MSFIIGGILGLVFYFLPTILAFTRKNKYVFELFIFNLGLGWTIIGWLGALSFAMFYKKTWKSKWNERFLKKSKQKHRTVNEHLSYYDEVDNFIKQNEDKYV